MQLQTATTANSTDVHRNLFTTWRCTQLGNQTGQKQHTCLFRRLYYGQDGFVMHVHKDTVLDNSVRMQLCPRYLDAHWRPKITRWKNAHALAQHLKGMLVQYETRLAVLMEPFAPWNIGHALFDGLYPPYVSMLTLGLERSDANVPVLPIILNQIATDRTREVQLGDRVAFVQQARLMKGVVKNLSEWRGGGSCTFRRGFDIDSPTSLSTGATNAASCCERCTREVGCAAAVFIAKEGRCYLKRPCPSRTLWPMFAPACGRANEGAMLCEPSGGRGRLGVSISSASAITLWVAEHELLGSSVPRFMAESIYDKFWQSDSLYRIDELAAFTRLSKTHVLSFARLFAGASGGNMLPEMSGAIVGSLPPLNAMARFRNRMYESYGLTPPAATRSGPSKHQPSLAAIAADFREFKVRAVDTALGHQAVSSEVIVVYNKRFSPADIALINVSLSKLRRRHVQAEYIDWADIGRGSIDQFKQHLLRVRRAHVYVSSIGTALQYVPFLCDGCVFVALGAVMRHQGRLIPTFMEQQLAGGGTPYVRTLYAAPEASLASVNKASNMDWVGLNITLFDSLLERAAEIVLSGFYAPLPPYENLGWGGKILLEHCQRIGEAACALFTSQRLKCPTSMLWSEFQVYEAYGWREGGECRGLDRDILRTLRKQQHWSCAAVGGCTGLPAIEQTFNPLE